MGAHVSWATSVETKQQRAKSIKRPGHTVNGGVSFDTKGTLATSQPENAVSQTASFPTPLCFTRRRNQRGAPINKVRAGFKQENTFQE
jgi:hypothetical protein